ncbi:hypothetical protein GA0111570_10716 [Raineyella antarctica]|uniref:Aromatic-ring-opening dioxygenase LigAB, LigA subunit n=1 Tax=Raineyella antarctica TaxID=1577474 RepID=A0A1G6H6F1_9ACTN|nr:hypothetical protein [Raineyella antarctica]SDB89754.1 hypothetical protein GA0111570_10716 [Raineyella antarctica]
MSIYQMQQCVFDHLRRLEDPQDDRRPDDVLVDGYDMTEEERTALQAGDVGVFHTLGVHPVLINAYCRANGWKRADYRVLFPAGADAVSGKARWQGFGSRADGRLDEDGHFHLTASPAASSNSDSPNADSPDPTGRPDGLAPQEA